MNSWAIVEGRKYNLEQMESLGISTHEEHGVTIKNVYLTKGKRVLVHTYSIWEDRTTHGVVGDQYHFADPEEIASLARRFKCPKLIAMVPDAE